MKRSYFRQSTAVGTKSRVPSGTLRHLLTAVTLPVLVAILTGHSQSVQGATNGTNIVQNGTFQALFDFWQGDIPAMGYNPHAPNGVLALPKDIYQFVPTIQGQSYFLSFYAAADLFFGPSVTFGVYLNNQQVAQFVTPPYGYNNQSNRDDQLHWQQFTVPFIASNAVTRLEFIDLNTPYFALADVSVVATGAPPILICSTPLNLASPSGSAIGTINAQVQSATGASLTVVWTVDGIPYQTNNIISAGGAPLDTNLTLTTQFTTGAHLVAVSASDGQTPPFTCSTTVTVYQCPLPNLVVNGSFESGFQGWTGTFGVGHDPNPVSGTSIGVVIDISSSSVNQCLTQIIRTVPGTTYQISFGIRLPELVEVAPGVWIPIEGDSRGLPGAIELQWNKRTILPVQVTSRDWTFYNVNVLSMATNNTLTFYNGYDTAWPFVDDISVTPVAQPAAMICPDPLVLECTNGSAVGTITIAPPVSCDPQEIVWAVDGVPTQTNHVPSSQALPPTNVTFTADFEAGEHLLTVSAITAQASSTTCSTTVTVGDTTPPVVTILGPDPMTNECHTLFTDPGATAADACAGPLVISTTSTVASDSPGVYSISYSATDPGSNTTTRTRTVFIVDTTPPRILNLSASPNVLWPPNGRMVPVLLDIAVSDNCDSSATARITKITSNQAPNSSAPDWEITGPLSANLRARRSGNGGDRIYTLFVQAWDSTGNKTNNTISVIVPHAQSAPKPALQELFSRPQNESASSGSTPSPASSISAFYFLVSDF